jgi:hypothetical protein
VNREDWERLKIVRNGVGKSLSERAYTPAQSESILVDALSECEKQRDEYAAAVADLTAQRNQFRDAELMWERLMMELLGEDGPGSVRESIEKLKRKVVHYITEARYHRDCERLCSREYDRIKRERETAEIVGPLKGVYDNLIRSDARYAAHLVRDAAHRLHDQNQALRVFKRSYLEAIQNASQDDQLTLQNYMGYAAQEIKKVLGDDSN